MNLIKNSKKERERECLEIERAEMGCDSRPSLAEERNWRDWRFRLWTKLSGCEIVKLCLLEEFTSLLFFVSLTPFLLNVIILSGFESCVKCMSFFFFLACFFPPPISDDPNSPRSPLLLASH